MTLLLFLLTRRHMLSDDPSTSITDEVDGAHSFLQLLPPLLVVVVVVVTSWSRRTTRRIPPRVLRLQLLFLLLLDIWCFGCDKAQERILNIDAIIIMILLLLLLLLWWWW
jgi:uncharacterized membrane protein YoaK (UPF0700 family)